ncbi:hypothetical protein NYE27_21080 [Paenibacillus sp. FSL R10-2779]|uniref:hypothetical protein n=1 Tax=Paenibacillus sp. FSL R10-2779 TaxID=2975340 RepID=UPI0030F59E3A
MALEILKTLNTGITLSNAYARIEGMSVTKESIMFGLVYYADKQAAVSDKSFVAFEQYYFVPSVADNAPNYHKQGYEYLKTLPEFVDAVDILE